MGSELKASVGGKEMNTTSDGADGSDSLNLDIPLEDEENDRPIIIILNVQSGGKQGSIEVFFTQRIF